MDIDDMVAEEKAKRLSSIMEVMNEIYARLPWGQEFTLADGRTAKLVKLVEPADHEDGPRFGFDAVFSDGGHIEFYARQTGWGSPLFEPKPMTGLFGNLSPEQKRAALGEDDED